MMRVLLLPLLFLAACAFAQTSPLNDTGQTQCFDAGTNALAECTAANTGDQSSHPRQDGRFGRDAQAGAGALTKTGSGEAGFDFTRICNSGQAAGSGTCPANPALGTGTNDWACTRDNVTGLIWEVKTPANAADTFNFADASAVHADAVNTAQLCGFNDWRVPARRELLSIVHHGRSSPAIDTTFFPNTQSASHWSSDIFAPSPTLAWVVNYFRGDTDPVGQSNGSHVRLVSGTVPPEPNPRFVDNLDGTVTDRVTGVVWDRCAWGQTATNCGGGSASTYTWQAALRIAVTANADNHLDFNDWRLPNRTELESLVDINKTPGPMIDTVAFPNTPSDFFWSSTVYTPNPVSAWGVSFNNGSTFANNRTNGNRVRLVRSGQSFEALAITVNTLDGGNDGVCGGNGADTLQDCSLLEAIALANSDPTPAVIRFSVDGVIPISASVVITTPVTIDGTTAPGGAHAVRIDASGAGNAIAISGSGASGSEVRGLVIGQSPGAGLVISSGAANVRILGNYIGTNADGDDLGNGSQGVVMIDGATDNTIGGNTIGFNGGNGVALSSSNTTGNVVVGNFIGTNAAGDDLGNAFFGASIAGGATDNSIGGAAPGEGNTIGFNRIYGIDIFDPGTSNNRVLGNFIGTNADGNELGNTFDGVVISGGATNNTIGGAAPGEGNTIGFNGTNGVVIAGADTTNNRVLGNFIGTDAAGNMLANGLSGVRIESGAMNNTFGGTAPDAANTIGFSNAEGVRLNGVSGNHVLGNFIGTNAAGDDLGNAAEGVVITGASTGNTIGGAASGEGNTIGFNDSAGVFLSSSNTTGNLVIGNFIGTNPAGDDLGNGFQGVAMFDGTTNNTIGGAASGEGNTIGFNDAEGVSLISGASGNLVLGNFIGTNAAGDDLGNDSDGVAIAGGATDNTIGGSEPGEGNSIGFNAFNGVLIAEAKTTDNRILGNFIGTDAAGNMLANGLSGVRIILGAANNTIGGAAPGESNIIGFNGFAGVSLFSSGTTGNVIVGNFIGTNAAGQDLGNGFEGIVITAASTGNTIGGTAQGESNTIGFNDAEGVKLTGGTSGNLVIGNFIGTNAAGDELGNSFDGLSISGGATDNAIGGAAPGEGNTIGFNGTNGVIMSGAGTSNNRVLGNFIGTDAGGALSGNGLDGVRIISGAANNTIEGNTIGFNGVAGVSLFSSDTTGNVIVGNFIGTNAAGDDLGHPSRGVLIANGASGNTIGGAAPGEGNTIGFNGLSGVWVVDENTAGNVMIGNFIGTNAQGEDLGNLFEGIVISGGATGNTVGGAAAGEGNTIGFNREFGVKVDGAGATDNRVLGNFIGTNVTGSDLGNLLHGVGVVRGATRNTIGGVAPGAGNTIRFNGDNGVLIAGMTTTGNAVLGNAIFDNATLGIDLSTEATIGDGVTANDGCGDPDQGPNGLQNFPALLAAHTGGGITTVDFNLDTAAGDYRVEFFSVLAADASGHGEGRTFLAAEEVSVSAICDETFLAVLPFEVATDRLITATATRVDVGQTSGFGGTSEFSAAVSVEIADRVFEDRFQLEVN